MGTQLQHLIMYLVSKTDACTFTALVDSTQGLIEIGDKYWRLRIKPYCTKVISVSRKTITMTRTKCERQVLVTKEAGAQ